MTLPFTEETILGGAAEAMGKKGRKYAKLAVEYADLRLLSAGDLDDNDMVLTASRGGRSKCGESVYDSGRSGKDLCSSSEKL